MGAGRKLDRFVEYVIDGMAVLAGLGILFVMFSIFYEVVVRYFHLQPPTWVNEVTEYLLLYITFLGAPWVLKEDGHVRVDIVVGRLRWKTQKLFDLGTSLAGMGICGVLVWYGTKTAWELYQRGIPVIKTLAVPKVFLVGIIPVGSLLLIAEFFRRARRFWDAFQKAETSGEEAAREREGL
ncbi:MAG: TRAP transporter small permease [Deltaproteobacteria bacterium]|nr:TRAP transporter small permease [Deltaproteobacteria bacterium]